MVVLQKKKRERAARAIRVRDAMRRGGDHAVIDAPLEERSKTVRPISRLRRGGIEK
jgi:hypothetical protein